MTHAEHVKNALRLALKATGRTQRSVSLGLGKYPQWLSNHLADVKHHSNGFINRVLGEVGIRRSDFEAYLEGRLGSDPRLHLAEIICSGEQEGRVKPRLRSKGRTEQIQWQDLESFWRTSSTRVFQSVATWHIENGSAEEQCEAWALLGASFRREGLDQSSAYCYLKACELTSSLEERELEGRFLVRTVQLFVGRAKLGLAESLARLGLERLTSAQNSEWLGIGYLTLGQVCELRGAAPEALQCFRIGAELRISERLKLCAAHAQGRTLVNLGNFDLAMEFARKALEIGGAESFEVQSLLAECFEGLGDLSLAAKHYNMAELMAKNGSVDRLNLLAMRVCRIRCSLAAGCSLASLKEDLANWRATARGVCPKYGYAYSIELERLLRIGANLEIKKLLLGIRLGMNRSPEQVLQTPRTS